MRSLLTRMSIRSQLMLASGALAVAISLLFGVLAYRTQRLALLRGVDHSLETAARLEAFVPPDGYFESIDGPGSVAPARYLSIVGANNRLCRDLGLQYLWSVLILEGQIVFTTATSPDHGVQPSGHAGFLEVHRDPASFAEAFATMRPTFTSFHNEWGHGRMVLVPGVDRRGRSYCLGASKSIAELDSLIQAALLDTVGLSLLVLALMLGVSVGASSLIAAPVGHIAAIARRISEGELTEQADIRGSTELASLSTSIEEMRRAIRTKIRQLQEHRDHLEQQVQARTAALERANADLERSNADLESFAYVASHDLQEPLRMVEGFGSLLSGRYRDSLDNSGQEFLDFMVDGAKRMRGLVGALLTYSRIERHGRPLSPTPVADALVRAQDNLAAAFEESGATLSHDELPTVAADPTQLTQLFQNLLANAIKYGAAERPPRIHVTAVKRDGEWLFAVRDNGRGIAADDLERIFGMFQRLAVEGAPRGTGIGLALCRRVVQRHGGRIWAESEVGQGSTFSFTFPESSRTTT